MTKSLVLICSIVLLLSCQNQAQNNNTNISKMETQKAVSAETIYQFKVKDLYGNEFDFASLKGKKILILYY